MHLRLWMEARMTTVYDRDGKIRSTHPSPPCEGCGGEQEPLNAEGMCGSCVRLDQEVEQID